MCCMCREIRSRPFAVSTVVVVAVIVAAAVVTYCRCLFLLLNAHASRLQVCPIDTQFCLRSPLTALQAWMCRRVEHHNAKHYSCYVLLLLLFVLDIVREYSLNIITSKIVNSGTDCPYYNHYDNNDLVEARIENETTENWPRTPLDHSWNRSPSVSPLSCACVGFPALVCATLTWTPFRTYYHFFILYLFALCILHA